MVRWFNPKHFNIVAILAGVDQSSEQIKTCHPTFKEPTPCQEGLATSELLWHPARSIKAIYSARMTNFRVESNSTSSSWLHSLSLFFVLTSFHSIIFFCSIWHGLALTRNKTFCRRWAVMFESVYPGPWARTVNIAIGWLANRLGWALCPKCQAPHKANDENQFVGLFETSVYT